MSLTVAIMLPYVMRLKLVLSLYATVTAMKKIKDWDEGCLFVMNR